MTDDELGRRVRDAHGDAWQVHGRLREFVGGGTAEQPGVRLMASGLPHPQWNNGDVSEPDRVDLDAVRAWYAPRAAQWGVRVPAGEPWPHGRHLFRKRLMGLHSADLVVPPTPPGVEIARAVGSDDFEAVLDVDLAVFGGDRDLQRRWAQPHFDTAVSEVGLARLDGAAVAAAYVVHSSGWAGPAAYLSGVCVLPFARGRRIAGALSAWLLTRAFAAGAELAHLHPDDERAAAVYRALGFVEVPGLDIYVDL